LSYAPFAHPREPETDSKDKRRSMISVVIPTRNRSKLLLAALEMLVKQDFNPADFEIIVVDNNSTDGTREIVEHFARDWSMVRYCFEPKTGCSHARNRGWQVARGDYVAESDDDAEFSKNWLAIAADIIERHAPAAFGGPVFSRPVKPVPPWFKKAYCSSITSITEARFLSDREYGSLMGPNLFLRREAIERAGGFDCSIGPGQPVGYGEETALVKAISAVCPGQLYYDPRLVAYNVIREDEMKVGAMFRTAFAGGRAAYRVMNHGKKMGHAELLTSELRLLFSLLFKLALSTISRDRVTYPYIQNYIFERTTRDCRLLGRLYERHRELIKSSQSNSLRRLGLRGYRA
jgi:glycosyltransferase involved in cell wall biosynthesis